jgi:hypothetical protein
MKEVWILGQLHGVDGNTNVAAWTVLGAFSSKEKAVDYCNRLGLGSIFVAPLEVDKELPLEIEDWPGCEYPLAGPDWIVVNKRETSNL